MKNEYINLMCNADGVFTVEGKIYPHFYENDTSAHLVFYFKKSCSVSTRFNPNIKIKMWEYCKHDQKFEFEEIMFENGQYKSKVYKSKHIEPQIVITIAKGNQFLTQTSVTQLAKSNKLSLN